MSALSGSDRVQSATILRGRQWRLGEIERRLAARPPRAQLHPTVARPSQQSPETLAGQVERVTFFNEETGFAVLRVKAAGQRDLVTVTGSAPSASAGEFVTAEGRWVNDRNHGRQFEASSLRTAPPSSPEGIERYLGSGLVRGVGPVLAAKLVGHFGAAVLDVIDQRSARLQEVDGIGPKRRERIKAAWVEQREVRNIMVFLHSHGVGSSRAVRIFKAYGAEAIAAVQADPYCLARDIAGVGFHTADQIAQRLGVAPGAPERLRASLRHTLLEAAGDGHSALPRAELIAGASKLVDQPAAALEPQLETALANDEMVAETIDGRELVFPPALRRAEIDIARRLLSLAARPAGHPSIDADRAIGWLAQRSGRELSASQQQALRAALTRRLLVITGGPGVGKTTLVNAIVQVLGAKQVRVALASPTGRAAQRLSEAAGLPASTLHRALESRGGSGFARNESRPLEGDLFVVDEASMIDLPLMAAWLRALPECAHLILVGDADQLPSVGPGSVLADLIACPAIPSVRLTEIFRQAAASQIIQNAHRINQGRMPILTQPADSDFFVIEREASEDIADLAVDLAVRRLPASYTLDPVAEIQVLTPMNRGPLGVIELNRRLQARLNPPDSSKLEILRFGTAFRVGDKVLQLENDYQKEVFNGDLGRVVGLDLEEQSLAAEFHGRRVEYTFGELDSLTLAYAITIHKAQGSEFPAVVLPLSTAHYLLLQRNLLYTGVTRGRRLVVVAAQRRALAIAVNQTAAAHRWGGLAWRLAQGRPTTAAPTGSPVAGGPQTGYPQSRDG